MRAENHCRRRQRIHLIAMALWFMISNWSIGLGQFKVPKIEPEETVLDFRAWEVLHQPVFGYNRVQGLFAGMDIAVYCQKLWHIKLQGSLGYGFEDQFRYRFGLQRSFIKASPLTVGAYYFDQVASLDDWYISNWENSLAALLFKADLKDFYGQKGWQTFLDLKLREQHTMRIELNRKKFQSLARQTNWSLFYRNKAFRDNPGVIQENATSARLLWVLDWLDTDQVPNCGWLVEGIAEYTRGDEMTTQGLFLTIKRLIPTFETQQLQMKLMLGARKGCDPTAEQYLMDLGGIGSLAGYQDKEFKNGNRLLYSTVHYLFNQQFMGRRPIRYLPFSNQFVFGVFVESGWLYYGGKNNQPIEDFSRLKIDDFKTDIGISLHLSDELARIDVAKRTDRAKDAWRLTVRLMPRF
ncbi:MAG: hypothetical protein ONB32_12520 [candidate division KSB1 bacterium]|nr:hypothetical protein [candidate division KSB1 bacterium]